MKARIVTGLIMAAGVILLLTLAPAWATWLLFMVAAFILPDELFRITLGAEATRERYAAMVAVAATVAAAFFWPAGLFGVMGVALAGLLSVVLYSDLPVTAMGPRAGMLLGGFAYLAFPLGSMALLASIPNGTLWILALFAAVFAGDTGAFFSGKFLGKKKLYEKISPKKTWAGAYGGAVASVLGFILVQTLASLPVDTAVAALLGLGCGIVGQVGDLAESLFKRAFGVKDSGTLLPGHGGLLDRVDGVLFAAPFLWLCLTLLNG